MRNEKSMTTSKKLGIISIALLTICAVILCCMVLGFNGNPNQEVAYAMSGGDGTEANPYIMTTVADWKTVIDRESSESDPTYVKLGANITASGDFSYNSINSASDAIVSGALNVPAGKYINLDLQTYKINRGRSGGVNAGHVMVVYGNLTMDGVTVDIASNNASTSGIAVSGGGITGGYTNGTAGGGGVYVPIGGTFTMNGGHIYNCYSALNADTTGAGGGVHVRGRFIMNGGSIHDCATTVGTTDGGGVGVAAASSSSTSGCGYFEMNGGKIFDNSAANHAGGIEVSGPGGAGGAPCSTFVMNGGEIYANVCQDSYAMAVGPWYGGKFIMNGGYIHDHVGNAGLFTTGNTNASVELNGGVISKNKVASFLGAHSAAYNLVKFGGGIQIYGNTNQAGTVERNYTPGSTRLTITGDLSKNGMARIGVTWGASQFTTGYGANNPNVSASAYFFNDSASNIASDTVSDLGATNEGTFVSGTRPANKITWKYRYEGETTWKPVTTAVSSGVDKYAVFAHESYLTLVNPAKKIYILPFGTPDATTPLVNDMSALARTTTLSTGGVGKTNYTYCSPSAIDYESGFFGLRYTGTGYLNSVFTLKMDLSIIFIDVTKKAVAYNRQYQDGILFDSEYLNYQVISKPSGVTDADAVKLSGDYLQFRNTGDYKIKFWFKDEYADQVEAGLVGWAETEWTSALEKKEFIEVPFTVTRGLLAIPQDETFTYNASEWDLTKAEGEWCTTDHEDSATVEITRVEYKNFGASATYAAVADKKMKQAGYYKVSLKVKDVRNYVWEDGAEDAIGTKTFNLNIEKAKILMNEPNVDEYGELGDGETISAKSGILPTDVSSMNGAYGLEYIKKDELTGGTWSRSGAPKNAGEYYVRPYILSPDNCNYDINYEINATTNVGSCYTLFERLKDTVAIPFLWLDGASVDRTTHKTVVPYTGAEQIFDIVNTRAEDGTYSMVGGVEVKEVSSGMTWKDTFTVSATNLREYTVIVGLTDPANNRWATGEKDNTADQTITLVITEAYLKVSYAYDDKAFVEANSFQKGEHGALILSAGKILNLSGSSQSKVTLDVTYTNSNGASGIIADTEMTIDGDEVKVTIDLLTLPIGTYNFKVRLRENITANDNYTLVTEDDGVITPVEELNFSFTILMAEINVQSLAWQYKNANINSGAYNEIAVDDNAPDLYYNRYAYEFAVAKIYDADDKRITNVAGIDFVLTTINRDTLTAVAGEIKNAGKYTTTVILQLKPDVDGYVIADSSKTSFYIDWEVLPVNFDLKDLTFAPNFTFDMDEHTMRITNPQISADPLAGSYDNTAIWAGDYTAGFAIYSDDSGNLQYYCTLDAGADGKYHLANGAVVWLDSAGNAYAEYDWKIIKAKINVNNSISSSWKEDIITDKNGAQFKSYLPKVYDEYEGILDIHYYTDAECTNEINVEDIIVQYELKKLIPYYVKATIHEDWVDNYELSPAESAVVSFNVGSTKKPLTIRVGATGEKIGLVEDSTNEFAAQESDKGYTFKAVASGLAASSFKITYYKQGADGEWEALSGNSVPTEVGNYKVSVTFARPNAIYDIKNGDYYLTIYEKDDPEMPDVTEVPDPEDPNNPPIDPENPDDPPSGDIPSGEDPSGNVSGDASGNIGGNGSGSGTGGGSINIGNVEELLRQWWQVIASAISIVLIIAFLSKTASYEGKRKKFNKKADKLTSNVYAVATTGLFGLAMTSWTIIACVLMGLAVASLVIMIIAKSRCNKAEENYEDCLEEYQRNKADFDERKREDEARQRDENMRMMLMGMMGGNGGNAGQGGYMGGYAMGPEEMRGLISETVAALLPGVQQALPQQASYNEEVIQRLVENQEIMMHKMAEEKSERVVEREVAVANTVNEETIQKLIDKNDERFAQMMKTQEALIAKLLEKDSAPQVIEKVIEKEVPIEKVVEKVVEVPVEKVVEKEVVKEVKVPVEKVVEKEVVKEVKVAAAAKPKKEVAPRLTLDEAYAQMSKQQQKYFDGLRQYALSKPNAKEKTSTYAITIGQSTVNPLLKLTIKKDMTVALFKMEDEYLKDIKRDASGDGTKIKVKETEVIISDAQACKAAKNMIDLREDQIERYNDLLKEQRSMRSKK